MVVCRLSAARWAGARSLAPLAFALVGCAGGVVDEASGVDDDGGGAGFDAPSGEEPPPQPEPDDASGGDAADAAPVGVGDSGIADSGHLLPGDVDVPPVTPDAAAADAAELADAADAGTSACTGKTRVVSLGDSFIADFESGGVTGWYDYGASGGLNLLALGSPGAAGTAHAGHLAAGGLSSFGAGMGFQTPCWDTAAFDGIAFWAKGTAGSDNRFQFQVAIPATHAVANGGDCVSNCFDHPSKQLTFTPDWTQYVVPFTDLKQAGWGTPASYTGMIMALNWVSVDAASIDFWVDEVGLYKGTAGTGPVGGTPPSDAGGEQ
ncbi:MAG TPA: hypothetical protein VGI39_34425 [Polyangiaceae bacterium]